MTPLESKLRRLVAALDAAALEALASKGLLRRAQKDLERGIETKIAGESGASLHVKIGEFEVTLPESGPATATCSCPSAGVCQHLLAAVLFLQTSAPAEAQDQLPGVMVADEAGSADQELMDITPEQLERWAGKGPFKAGLKLASHTAPEILHERAVRIRFPALNSEVHFIPGGGLNGMIVSGGRGDDRNLVVAAVVGFQRAQGKAWEFPADVTTLEASEGAPRSRVEVLRACQSLLDDTLANGLSRLSAANQQRWATLAVSALGVNLPRLALLIRGIGDEAALAVSRHAGSDVGRMFGRMAQTHALCTVLQNGSDNPRADLVGLHRTRYDEIGHLDLIGAAAWPWRTASGYEGLTVLFWDPSARRWNSWTESRPRHQLADFKPTARYTQPGPWEGAESPRQLARNAFRLMNARRNSGNRLSGSSKSRVLVTGPGRLQDHGLVLIEDWSQLMQRSNALTAVGLTEVNPLDAVFALKPAVFGARAYDAVMQVFTWVVFDSQQRPLLLEIGFDEFTEPAIKYLEGVIPDSLPGAVVVGRLQRTARGVSLHPYSLHLQNRDVVHLCLDNLTGNSTRAVAAADEAEDALEEEEEVESTPILSSSLSRALDELDDGLLALAESGLASPNMLRIERLRQFSPRTERLGLQGLAVGLGNLVAAPTSETVLRCSYLCQLHRRAMPHST